MERPVAPACLASGFAVAQLNVMQTHVGDRPTVNAPAAATGSSFYAAMRVLPAPQRRAMFAIYGFCRAVDDVADGNGAREARLAELRQWRADIDALFAEAPPARVRPLAEPVRAFDLQRDDFSAVIDGMEMDTTADIRAPARATLDTYCDRVAGAVGRLSVRVFGMPASDGEALALHLGRALQLTNILRDLDEDAAKGRLYLPRESLLAAGVVATEPRAVLGHPALRLACAELANDARGHFGAASRVMSRHPLRIVRAPLLMAKVYQTMLDRLEARGFAPPRRPVHADRITLLWILLRYGLLKPDGQP
jgi:presqualene diphosphate synthase